MKSNKKHYHCKLNVALPRRLSKLGQKVTEALRASRYGPAKN